MINRAESPLIKDAVDFTLTLPAVASYTLNNGVPVYEVNAGAQEVAQIEFVFYAGNFFEEQQSIAAATNTLTQNGTSTKTAYQLNEAFDYLGAFCSRSCYNETAVIKLNCLSKRLPELIPIIAEMITDATFPDEELATFKQNSKQRLSVNLQKSEFVASRLIDAYLYGRSHPYGKYTEEQDIDQLDAELLRKFYDQYYRQGECIIFVSGKFTQNVEAILNASIGQLPIVAPKKTLPTFALQPEINKKHHITNDPQSVQGAIRIGRSFVNRKHPDFSKLMLLNTIFGGYYGSRLMSNIREDKGYTYGIYSYGQNHLSDAGFIISTEAGKDVCAATIEEVYKEMNLLKTELITEEELSLVRNYMIGSILGSLDGPFQIMAKWKNIILNDLTEESFYKSIHDIKTTTAEELQALAQQYFNQEEFYELVVY